MDSKQVIIVPNPLSTDQAGTAGQENNVIALTFEDILWNTAKAVAAFPGHRSITLWASERIPPPRRTPFMPSWF